MAGNKHYIYYIDVLYTNGQTKRFKQTSSNPANAIINLTRKLMEDRTDIRRIYVPDGVLKTKKNREEAHNRKIAQRERRKREAESKIMTTRFNDDGTVIRD